jgi:hypothetical protein
VIRTAARENRSAERKGRHVVSFRIAVRPQSCDTRGERNRLKGRCVICDAVDQLTNDPVPPRSVTPPTPLEWRPLTAVVQPDAAARPRGGFQAAQFPSLCKVCNTERLGVKYAPTHVKLAADVRRWPAVTNDLGIWVPGDIQWTTLPLYAPPGKATELKGAIPCVGSQSRL